MQKIMFNQTYGLQQAVFDGRKPITRREPYFGEVKNPNVGFYLEGKDKNRLALADGNFIVAKSRYAVGEVVAIAQRYSELSSDKDFLEKLKAAFWPYRPFELEGWYSKLFVKAELMPRHIKITNIRCERLQDISDDDCLREGIQRFETPAGIVYCAGGLKVSEEDLEKIKAGIVKLSQSNSFDTPREAFAALIDKTSGKATWSKNPWVFVYSFTLID